MQKQLRVDSNFPMAVIWLPCKRDGKANGGPRGCRGWFWRQLRTRRGRQSGRGEAAGVREGRRDRGTDRIGRDGNG